MGQEEVGRYDCINFDKFCQLMEVTQREKSKEI